MSKRWVAIRPLIIYVHDGVIYFPRLSSAFRFPFGDESPPSKLDDEEDNETIAVPAWFFRS